MKTVSHFVFDFGHALVVVRAQYGSMFWMILLQEDQTKSSVSKGMAANSLGESNFVHIMIMVVVCALL